MRFKLNLFACQLKRVGEAHVDHTLKPLCITRGPNKADILSPLHLHVRSSFYTENKRNPRNRSFLKNSYKLKGRAILYHM